MDIVIRHSWRLKPLGKASYAVRKQEIAPKIKEALHQNNQRPDQFRQKARFPFPTAFGSSKPRRRKKGKRKNQKTRVEKKGERRNEEGETTLGGAKIQGNRRVL